MLNSTPRRSRASKDGPTSPVASPCTPSPRRCTATTSGRAVRALSSAERGDGAGLLACTTRTTGTTVTAPGATRWRPSRPSIAWTSTNGSRSKRTMPPRRCSPRWHPASRPGTTGSYFCTFFPPSTDPRSRDHRQPVPARSCVCGTTGNSATPLQEHPRHGRHSRGQSPHRRRRHQPGCFGVSQCADDLITDYLVDLDLPPPRRPTAPGRPSTRPSTRPSARPATRPSKVSARSSTRSSTRPAALADAARYRRRDETFVAVHRAIRRCRRRPVPSTACHLAPRSRLIDGSPSFAVAAALAVIGTGEAATARAKAPPGSSSPDASVPESSEPVITAPSPDPSASFQPAAIEWSMDAFGEGVDEGHLVVPIDYANPDAGSFTLYVTRHRATGDRVGSLLVNPGGPGFGGSDFAIYADQIYERAAARRLRHHRLGPARHRPQHAGDRLHRRLRPLLHRHRHHPG